MAGTKPLVMVVDGDVRGLQTAARAASAVTAEIAERIAAGEKDARASLEDYGLAFDRLADVSKTAMSQMASNINAEFRNMARDAERAARLGEDFNPVAGFNSEGQQRFADNMRKLSAEAYRQAQALEKVAAAGGPLATSQQAQAANALLNAKNFALEADAAELVADELRKVEVASGGAATAAKEAAGTSGAMRAGFQQAGFQISDFAVQVGGGTSAIRAGAQQAPQLIQALALMGSGAEESSSKFARFATFMGGPWGAAITIGVSILGALATSLLDTDDAAEKAESQTYDFSKSLDFLVLKADAAQDAIKQLVGETERLLKVQGNFDRQIAANAEQALAQGKERLRKAEQRVADIENAPGLSNRVEELFTLGEAKKELEAARKFVADAQIAAQNAQLGLSQRRVEEARDPFAAKLNGIDEQIGAIETRRRNSIDVERLDPRIRQFELAKRDAVYISEAEYQAELKRLQGLREEAEKARTESKKTGEAGARGSENALGGTVALLKQLFPGVQITSTTGGLHVKGSDHYAGRAVDFVLPGQMSPEAFEQVKATLEEAGVKIRRNASGRQQFFGPGNGAKTANDHNDHFHLGFEGSPSPEAADRVAAQRAEKAQRSREALDGALLASKEEQARLARRGVTDLAKLAELDVAAIDAGLARKLAANAKLELDHTELDALDKANAEIEKRAVTEKLRNDLAERALEEERRRIGVAAQIIEIEGQLATTTKAKKAAAQKLLELRYQDEKKAAEQQLDRDLKEGNPNAVEAYLDRVGIAQANKQVDQKRLEEDFRSDSGRYFDRLKDNVSDMDEAFDGVAARGLQALEDGLVGLIDGTENVATAFKRMAASIIADLARIAVQKIILSAFGIGFKGGDVPAAAATGMIPGFASGIISGPGSGTSDSILAFHETLGPIRVSNGESIITAEGTRKHRRLLKAINDNTLPSFAGGMIADVAYPAIPSAASLRGGAAGPTQYFDLRGAVVTEELYRTMHQIGAAHAARALAAAPAMAMDEMAHHNAQRIPG